MIQKLSQLNFVIKGFTQSVQGTGAIQKIYSTTRYICFVIRYRGSTRFLYFGRGKGYEGVFSGEGLPPSSIRIQDRFLDYLRSHIKGLTVTNFLVAEDDRICTLELLEHSQNVHYFLFFWCGRQLYFIHHYLDTKMLEWEIFCSWSGYHKTKGPLAIKELQALFYQENPQFRPLPPEKRRETKEDDFRLSVKQLLEEEESSFHQKQDKKELKFLKKKRVKILFDIDKNRVWNELTLFVQRPGLDLTVMDKMEMKGLLIEFHPDAHHFKRLDLVYQKIKKLKKGEQIQLKRLQQIDAQMSEYEAHPRPLAIDRKKIIQPVWWKESSKESGREKRIVGSVDGEEKNWIEMMLGGVKAAVGRNAEGSDYLRSQWASKEDLWLHLDGYTGAHAILKTDLISNISQHQLEILASAMVDYSTLELMVIPLIFTKVKYIKGVKGKSGLVIFTKQRYITVPYIKNWSQELLING